MQPTLRPGRYRHYKGNDYQVLDIAQHSETEQWLVVYRCLYGDHSLWVRPLTMFTEMVTVDGCEVERFKYYEPMSVEGAAKNKEMNNPCNQTEIDQTEWEDSNNWSSIYFSKKDSRVWVAKKNPKHGWTINFGSSGGARWIYYFFFFFLVLGSILGGLFTFITMGSLS